ncbi:MAG TPA: hypothetical protein VGJ39_09425 [Vicinamibacterales bacterium]|jgi:hypothetical protein
MNTFVRVIATIVVACGAYATVYLTSGTTRAIEYIDRIDSALVDLSHSISDAHASIRDLVAEGGSRDDAIADFNAAVDRRLMRLRRLNTLIDEQTATAFWKQPLQGNADIQRIDEERGAYVNSATTTLTTPVFDPARSVRMFDLQAQKLIQTVESVRDSAATARERARIASETTVEVASGLGALLIAYLIWRPAFGGVRQPSRAEL